MIFLLQLILFVSLLFIVATIVIMSTIWIGAVIDTEYKYRKEHPKKLNYQVGDLVMLNANRMRWDIHFYPTYARAERIDWLNKAKAGTVYKIHHVDDRNKQYHIGSTSVSFFYVSSSWVDKVADAP